MGKDICENPDRSWRPAQHEGLSKNDQTLSEAFQAAVHLELTGGKHIFERPFGHIGDGMGPYQSLKCALPKMSDEAAAKLAHMINDANGKHVYRSGEDVNSPNTNNAPLKALADDVYVKGLRTDAELFERSKSKANSDGRLNEHLNDIIINGKIYEKESHEPGRHFEEAKPPIIQQKSSF